jgi:hypothetical protein
MVAETDFPTSADFSTSKSAVLTGIETVRETSGVLLRVPATVTALVLVVLALATAVETGFFDGH